jgi:hypothetical protein
LYRRLIVLGLMALVMAASAIWFRSNARAPEPEDLSSIEAMTYYLSTLLASGPLSWLLAVPRLVIAPFLAPDARAFAFTLGPALLVLAAHYAWVLRSEVAFEEASVAKAEKRAARLMAIRQGNWRANAETRKGQREPFRLTAAGRPEFAFLWKNLLSTHSFFTQRAALIAAAVIAAGCTWLAAYPMYRGAQTAVAGIAMMTAGFMLLLGPQMARQDLRSDLLNADILKTYPLRGWQIVLGELLAPLAIISVLLWLALLAAALSVPADGVEWLTLRVRAGIAVGLALLALPFCALQLLVQNAIAVLFPAWAQSVSNRGEHGLDVMGQRIIFLIGQALVAAIALLPAALGAFLLFFTTRWIAGTPAAAILALIAVLAILGAEVWLGVRWLGGRFERFDLSSELRP